MLPIFDLTTGEGRDGLAACLARLRATASASGEAAATVASVMQDVAEHGDEALVKYMRQWTDPAFEAERIRVSQHELDAAASALSPTLRGAIERAIANVRSYQRHVMPSEVEPVEINGATLGMKWSAVDSAGLCVPGGTAVLFSTLVMLAVPAQVAGVPSDALSVVSPPPTGVAGGDISPIVLATCRLLGVENVYRIGGAQAVAALAYGTHSVKPVDLIAGPGNVYVQLAKAQLGGVCGTDNGFYGPSEIVTVADGSAKPDRVAADLIAQAEHNPGKCFLIAWDRAVIDGIIAQVQKQLAQRSRSEAIVAALQHESCAVLADDHDHAMELANTFAAEHVNLAVADPEASLQLLRHAGEVFVGDQTPVAAGDYYAGPSHCLPTGTSARFTSGISVYTFLKRTGTVGYPGGMDAQTITDIAAMAEAEGLDGHAASVRLRGR